MQITRLVARGHTNAEIATILFISPDTVKNHIAGIQNKLGTRNRVDIAAWAWESGIMTS
ncbi:helix-turn-helix transcriptional regulator [Nonomuraea fuscirosea]